MELAATHNLSGLEGVDALRKAFLRPPRPGGANDEAILTRTICYIPDVWKDPKYQHQGLAQAASYRSILSVPILRHGTPIGTITVTGASPEMFNERQIELLKTFADQAVIAIENTRLFEAEQASKRELQESLEYQTATSEVLSVISRSKVDLQPVFGAILDCAVRLCGADQGGICKVEDGQLDLIEYNPSTPDVWAVIRESYPRPVDTTSLTGRAVVEARVIHVPDTEAPTAPASRLKGLGFRSQLSVPLLRSGQPIGVLALQRQAPGPFS